MPQRYGARVTVRLLEPGGAVAGRRQARNAVLQGGAQLVADLFRGAEGGGAINMMSVGADPAPEVPPFTTTELAASSDSTGELTGPRDAAVDAAAFSVTVEEPNRRVRVSARVLLPAGDDSALAGPVAEAALLHTAPDGTRRLYNRVTFEPIEKRTDQELSLYWEIFFPFGDPD